MTNPRPRPLRYVRWGIVSIAVLAVSVLAASASRRDLPSNKDSHKSNSTTPTIQNIYALGRLEPAGRVLRLSAASGNDGAIVDELRVAEGDYVVADQVLTRLDNYDRRVAAKLEAAAKLRAATARLAQVKAGAKEGDIQAQSAATQLWARQTEFAQKELQRAKHLQEQRILTLEDLESKQWTFERVVLEHRRAERQLNSIREVREVDVEVAAADVATAEAALVRAEAELVAAEVRAPAAGRILKIHVRRGEKLPDTGLLEMGDVSRMQAVAEVFEADIVAVQRGQRANILLSSANIQLKGTVAEVGYLVGRKIVLTNDPVSDTDARVVEVRIDLSPEDCRRVERLSQSRVEVSIDTKLPEAGSSGANEHQDNETP